MWETAITAWNTDAGSYRMTVEPDEALKAWRAQLEFEPSREYVEAMQTGIAALDGQDSMKNGELYAFPPDGYGNG